MAVWTAFGEDKVGQNEIVLNTWRVAYKSAGDRLKKVAMPSTLLNSWNVLLAHGSQDHGNA